MNKYEIIQQTLADGLPIALTMLDFVDLEHVIRGTDLECRVNRHVLLDAELSDFNYLKERRDAGDLPFWMRSRSNVTSIEVQQDGTKIMRNEHGRKVIAFKIKIDVSDGSLNGVDNLKKTINDIKLNSFQFEEE